MISDALTSSDRDHPNESELDNIPKLLIVFSVVLVALAFGFWLYLKAFARFDPLLWYLNWPPGIFSLGSFLNGYLGTVLVMVTLATGILAGLAKQTPMPMVVATVCAIALLGASDDGLSRYFAFTTHAATIECNQPGTRACLLNDFARIYDLGWSRLMSANEKVQYAQYAALRERAKVAKPDDARTEYQLLTHQQELRKWEERFKPELDEFLGSE